MLEKHMTVVSRVLQLWDGKTQFLLLNLWLDTHAPSGDSQGHPQCICQRGTLKHCEGLWH